MAGTRPKIRFLQKPSCTSCRKARALLEKSGAELEMRNLDTERLSTAEIDALIGARDYIPFLNTRNELYRRKKMSAHPPSRSEAVRLMAGEPNLIRRPVVIRGNEMVLGCDEKALKDLVK
jgi:Spx/MgsR family transcriptional regulator